MEDIRCLMNAMNSIFRKKLLLDEFLKIFEYCYTHYDFTESNWGDLGYDDPFWLYIIDNYKKYHTCDNCKANTDENPKKQETTLVMVNDFDLILCRDCYTLLKSAKILFSSEEEVFRYIHTKKETENTRLKTKC